VSIIFCPDKTRVVHGPLQMVVVPPRHYCIVANPVQRGEDGEVVSDKWGQVKLQHAEQEVSLGNWQSYYLIIY
jgi:major vault protein